MSKNENAVIELNKKENNTETKIETIKNLIFGDDIKAYDSEFEALKKDINDKKKVLEALIEEVRIDLKTALDNVSTDVNIRISELEEKLEDKIDDLQEKNVSRTTLGELLIDLGKKVSSK